MFDVELYDNLKLYLASEYFLNVIIEKDYVIIKNKFNSSQTIFLKEEINYNFLCNFCEVNENVFLSLAIMECIHNLPKKI